MFQPFEPVSKALRMQDRAMGVMPPVVSTPMQMQDRAVGMTAAIATGRARAMSATAVQHNIAGRAARSMADHGLERVRRVQDIGISAPRHHELRSVRATAGLTDSNPVASTLERTRRAPRWSGSSRASRALGNPYGIREVFGVGAIFDASNSGPSAYVQRQLSQRRAISREVSSAVQNARAVLRDAQCLPALRAAPSAAFAAPSGSPLLSMRDRARLRETEQKLQRVAMVTALDLRWNRQVESALTSVRRVLRSDSAAARASSALFNVRSVRTSGLASRGLPGTYSFFDPADVLRNSPLYVVDRYLARDVFRASGYGALRPPARRGLEVSPALLGAMNAAEAEMAAELVERGWQVSEDAPAVTPVDEAYDLATEAEHQEQVMEAMATLIALYTSAQARGVYLLRAGGEWTDVQMERVAQRLEEGQAVALDWAWQEPLWAVRTFVVIRDELTPTEFNTLRAQARIAAVAISTGAITYASHPELLTTWQWGVAIAGAYVPMKNLYDSVRTFSGEAERRRASSD